METSAPALGPKATRRSQVREQMDVINAASASTRDSLRALLERLDSVLRQEPTSCTTDSDTVQAELVPVANELRNMHTMAAGNNAILIDILDRLEL